MNDNLYGVQDIRGSTSVDLSKGIVVCPLLSFYFFFSFFYFLYFLVASMALSISLICPLWDLLICPLWDLLIFQLWDLFLTLGQHSIYYKKYRRSFTLYKSTQHKENKTIMKYVNVCQIGRAHV